MEQLVMVCTGNKYSTMDMYIIFDTDIDECSEDTDNCSQTCTNTDGNFTCGCINGYLLDTDGTTCKGMYMEHIQCCVHNNNRHKNTVKTVFSSLHV